MTLEEIFHAYEFNLRHGFVNNADKYREQIIAALRRLERFEKAGQAMRNCIADDTGARTRLNAAEAWDAATKEDV